MNKFSDCTSGADFKLYRLESELTNEDHAHLTFPRSGNRGDGSCTLKMSDASQNTKIKNEVLNAGGSWPFHDATGAEIKFLADLFPDGAGLLAQTTGWKGAGEVRWFCLPDTVVGRARRSTFLEASAASRSLARTSQGGLENWQRTVAEPAAQSPIAMLSILCGFASPLISFSSLREGFILNIAGDGSSGKSTANRAAASVWGNPDHIGSWNSTQTALAEMAGANSHLLLVLDDAEQASPNPENRIRAVQALTHLLTSGKSRAYSKTVSGKDQLAQHSFETIILSSSPSSVETHMQAKREDRTDGDRARLLELVIPPGQKAGIWVSIDGRPLSQETAVLSDRLNEGARRCFGVAGAQFVQFLCDHMTTLDESVERYRTKFRNTIPGQLTNVEGRIADKMALLYAAGRLAINARVLPWDKARLKDVTSWGLKEILASSRAGKFDPAPVAMELRDVFNDRELFPSCKDKKLADYILPESCLGVVHKANGRIYAKLDPLVLELGRRKGRVLSDSQRRDFISFMQQKSLLLRGENGASTRTVRINSGKPRMLVFQIAELTDFFNE